MAPPPSCRSAVWPLWPCLLLCAGVAVWIDLGTLHRGFYADALLPIYNSLYRWSLFVWEQERIGMLSPLLALPFQEPLSNLLVQDAFDVFCGLAAFFLLAHYLLRDATYPLVAALGAAAFIALPPSPYRYEFLVNTFDSVWLALGLGGLVVLERTGAQSFGWRRGMLALGLLSLAHWVYCTAALFLGPLVLFRSLFNRHGAERDDEVASAQESWPPWMSRWWRSEAMSTLVLLGLSFLVGWGLRTYRLRQAPPPIHRAWFGTLPARLWLSTLRDLLANTFTFLAPSPWPWLLLGLMGLGLLLLAVPAVRRQAALPLRAAAALLLSALVVTLFLATRKWVLMNLCFFRYILPCVFFAQAAVIAFALAPLAAALGARARRGLSLILLLLVPLAAVYGYGHPSLQGVRRDLGLERTPEVSDRVPPLFNASRDAIVTEEVLAAGCTHIAGEYWKVYPALFRANQTLYERGELRTIWGLTDRCQPTFAFWKDLPPEELCVAIPAGGDPRAEYFFKTCGLPALEVVERLSSVWILRPKASAEPEEVAEAAANPADVQVVGDP